MFNQYGFIASLQEDLKERIQSEEITTTGGIYDFITEEVDNACIYYADCFDIIKTLNFTDFSGSDFEITNVSQAAYAALYEFAQESVDFNELENLLENA
jgi:hypothetical protein